MNKTEIVNKINNIKNKPIADLKNNLVENSSGTEFTNLMQYNAMLDNILIGAHTTTTIEYAGVAWNLRLLTGEEFINVRLAVDKKCRDRETFAEYFQHYELVIGIMTKALSPNPFKTEGATLWKDEDLRQMNFDVLEELYMQYIEFVQLATKKPTEISPEEIEGLLKIFRKKPEALKELSLWKLRTISLYLLKCLEVLEQKENLDTSN